MLLIVILILVVLLLQRLAFGFRAHPLFVLAGLVCLYFHFFGIGLILLAIAAFAPPDRRRRW